MKIIPIGARCNAELVETMQVMHDIAMETAAAIDLSMPAQLALLTPVLPLPAAVLPGCLCTDLESCSSCN